MRRPPASEPSEPHPVPSTMPGSRSGCWVMSTRPAAVALRCVRYCAGWVMLYGSYGFRPGELEDVGAAAYEAADEVLARNGQGLADVAEVVLHPVGELRLGRREVGRGLDRRLGVARGGVALLAGGVQGVLRGLLVVRAGVGEGRRCGRQAAGVLAVVDLVVVGLDVVLVLVDGRVVRLRRRLARGDTLLPQAYGLLGLAACPVQGLGIGLQGQPGVRAGGGGVRPFRRLRGELGAEGLGAQAVPAAGIQVRQARVARVEGHRELRQVRDHLADLVRIPVAAAPWGRRSDPTAARDVGTEAVGDMVALVLHPVRRVVEPDVVEPVPDDVRSVVDDLAGLLLDHVAPCSMPPHRPCWRTSRPPHAPPPKVVRQSDQPSNRR